MGKTNGLSINRTTELGAGGEWTRLALAGPVNEDAKSVLMPLVDTAGPRCILDLGEVTYLNSVGIRDWSLFLKSFKTAPGGGGGAPKPREIVFDRCTDEVVRTMNMVTNFHYRLPVRSLFRAYGCEHCGHEQTVLLREGVDYQVGQMPDTPAQHCAQCAKISEPFVLDEEFFQFLVGT